MNLEFTRITEQNTPPEDELVWLLSEHTGYITLGCLSFLKDDDNEWGWIYLVLDGDIEVDPKDGQTITAECTPTDIDVTHFARLPKAPRKKTAVKFGDVVRAKCGAPARAISDTECLFVSSMCNDLSVDSINFDVSWDSNNLPLPTDKDLEGYKT